ncbi:MAG: FtsX-like permease family protein [Conexivisphaerales archaeon]
MKILDLLRFSWRAMTDRRLRTTLTILGIIIGPATIVALLGATQGFSNSVTEAFAKTGTNSIFIQPIGRNYLTSNDVATLQKLQGVSAVVPYYLLAGTITQGGQTITVQVMAGDFSELYKVLPGLTLAEGNEPASSDLAGADVGWLIANPNVAGATNISLNQIVTVSFSGFNGLGVSGASGEKSFIVRGIFAPYGQGFLINPDEGIFIPLAEGQAILHSYKYSGIIVVASNTSVVNQVVTEITNQYGQSVRVTAVTQILNTIQSITNGIGTILASVGGISVIVAFIGIMTTMFTTVVERQREIGTLKALGYTSRNILSIFIVEAAMTGFIGGVIGAGAGVVLSYLVVSLFSGFGSTARPPQNSSNGAGFSSSFSSLHIVPAISPELIILAILLATSVGALAGFIPAWKASRLTPIEALRYE